MPGERNDTRSLEVADNGNARAAYFRIGDSDLVALSIPHGLPELPDFVTSKEREVLELLMRGHRQGDIAQARGVSERTVAKQVASLFRKFRVGCRLALIAKVNLLRAQGNSERVPNPTVAEAVVSPG